jgi:hypothetical protein
MAILEAIAVGFGEAKFGWRRVESPLSKLEEFAGIRTVKSAGNTKTVRAQLES